MRALTRSSLSVVFWGVVCPIALAAGIAALEAREAEAQSPESLMSFSPPSAQIVVGIDLQPATYARPFSTLALHTLTRDPRAARFMGWVEQSQIVIAPDTAMSFEDDQGHTAALFDYVTLRDSHWLRLEALMGLNGMSQAKVRGAQLWTASPEAEPPLPEGMAVARLNDTVLAVGHEVMVKAIVEAARSRPNARGPMAELASSIPRAATAWFALWAPASEQPCGKEASGYGVLDDGLLIEIRWRCDAVEAANAHRDAIAAALKDEALGREFAQIPELIALIGSARIQRVGTDVVLVITSRDARLRAILKDLARLALPAFKE